VILTALTAISPSIPEEDRARAKALAAAMGVRQVVVESRELDDPNYAANPANRCYFCKSELYRICAAQADALGVPAILDGTNTDDLADHRPGRAAAAERGVRSPLVEAGLTKADIRALSRALELPTWDQPSSPCLSSRSLRHARAEAPDITGARSSLGTGVFATGVRHHNPWRA
jgi:uncharacterized protein